MRPEKLATNKYGISHRLWGMFTQEEKVHCNKLYEYLVLHQEQFITTTIGLDEWRHLAKKVATLSAEILRRGKLTGYADERRSKFSK